MNEARQGKGGSARKAHTVLALASYIRVLVHTGVYVNAKIYTISATAYCCTFTYDRRFLVLPFYNLFCHKA